MQYTKMSWSPENLRICQHNVKMVGMKTTENERKGICRREVWKRAYWCNTSTSDKFIDKLLQKLRAQWVEVGSKPRINGPLSSPISLTAANRRTDSVSALSPTTCSPLTDSLRTTIIPLNQHGPEQCQMVVDMRLETIASITVWRLHDAGDLPLPFCLGHLFSKGRPI